jgi:hypothetical protein
LLLEFSTERLPWLIIDNTDIDNLIESMFVWYKEVPNKDVKKIDYEIEKNIYSYWK